MEACLEFLERVSDCYMETCNEIGEIRGILETEKFELQCELMNCLKLCLVYQCGQTQMVCHMFSHPG
jgi:hypothetical protein